MGDYEGFREKDLKISSIDIMHEFFHFCMWHAFHNELMGQRIDERRYNDSKESLMELLNIEYVDLIGGAIDDGYVQHAEMRKKVHELWLATKDVRRTVFRIALL